ncbi:MAG: aminopeptidase [Candidatus Pacearchaeota archaeon]
MDLRTQKLAKLLVNYSVAVKPNEVVIISGELPGQELIKAIYKETILNGAHPVIRVNLPGLNSFFYKYGKKHQIERFPAEFDFMVKNAQKYIGIISPSNTKELTEADSKKITARNKATHAISDYIVNEKNKIRRCTTLFPSESLAQEAEMDLINYENFVYSACLLDWKKLGNKMGKILFKFKKNSKVHLIGEGINLTFNVHGDKSVADKGEENMPGGEIFMAPVRESLNGYVKFEYPAVNSGKEVAGIELTFKNGKVIKFNADKNKEFLEEMLNADENSSYVGEFGIGVNPNITKFTKNLLFDEKIDGTIHLALGMAYKENGGGNDSSIHWDIVKDMSRAKIIVDGKILQENGVWKI